MAKSTKGLIPDPTIPSEFVGGLYNPEFLPEDLDLNDFVEEVEVRNEEVRQSLDVKSSQGVTTRLPITEEEAAEAAAQIKTTLKRLETTKERIQSIRSQIDLLVRPGGSAAGGGSSELSFRLDISKKPRLRRAIQKLFGYKTDTITYSMYKELLRAKNQLEQDESYAYVAGTPLPEPKVKKGKRE